MKKLSWQVDSVEDGWAELREQAFLYLVPVHRLPPDLQPGDRILAEEKGNLPGYPAFRRQSRAHRRRSSA